MIVSTRGRYALRVLIELAEQESNGFKPLKEIANHQKISIKYLECIMTELSKNGLVIAQHGKGGGYKLNKAPSEYKIGDILRITEGTLAPVACLEDNASECPQSSKCKTIKLWKELDELVKGYLDNKTLADLMVKDEE